jgi:hypothetical protein
MKKLKKPLGKGPERPSPWITDMELNKQGLAPTDATYAHSSAFLFTHPDWYLASELLIISGS